MKRWKKQQQNEYKRLINVNNIIVIVYEKEMIETKD